MPSNRETRRGVLVAACGFFFGSAGCLSTFRSSRESNSESESTTANSSNLILEYVTLSNHHESPHAIRLQIKRESNVVLRKKYQVAAFDDETNVAGTELVKPPAFPREEGNWTVSATLDFKSDRTELQLKELPYEKGCINVTIRITPEGTLTALNDTPDCSTTEKEKV
ncbi:MULTISPECIES: hypothetical protein [Halorussus]|uniref:hypothetical protein n=1 Tax=Halorussus TaxID=1070314 RepID=UPI00209E0489|nr:hypothetical protein [Halorussus vallis]USZ76617.1 hypothetical protein NGM07_04645 [Halorussus vallis]